jgi:hypothetical protein
MIPAKGDPRDGLAGYHFSHLPLAVLGEPWLFDLSVWSMKDQSVDMIAVLRTSVR